MYMTVDVVLRCVALKRESNALSSDQRVFHRLRDELQGIVYVTSLFSPSFGCCYDPHKMPSSGTKKQLTFGHRRHIAKPRTSLGSIEAEKRQSSLTQLDFVSTPQPSNEVIRIPDTDDEDEEFVIDQPKKKRRVSSKNGADDSWTPKAGNRSSTRRRSAKIKQENGREKGQQTMTQMDFVPSSHRPEVEDDIEDEQDYGLSGSDGETNQQTRASKTGGRKRTIPWLDQEDDVIEKIPASSDTPTRESIPQSPARIVHQPPDLTIHSIAAYDFTTPKKTARNSEIPSSQSPPSIKLSSKCSQKSGQISAVQASPSKRANTPRRSPLKEKNANIGPQRWQPETQESQNPVMRMLEQVRLHKKLNNAPLHEAAPMPPPKRPQSRVLVEASQDEYPPTQAQPPPRKLRRVATVQDSQADDDNLMTQAAPPNLSRVSTVQDSQHEDLDLSSQLYRSISSRENVKELESQTYNNEYDDNEYDDPGPHTFDPVSAALDRDAARYAWTQTQAPRKATQQARTQIEDSEAESDDDDDDLDRGIVPDSDNEDEVVLVSKPANRDGPSQEISSHDMSRKRSETPKEQDDGDETILVGEPRNGGHAHKMDSCDLLPKHGEEPSKPADVHPPSNPEKQITRSTSNSPPSSPPALHPSQVSTIIPTQASPQHRHHPTTQPNSNEPSNDAFSPPRPFSAAKKRHASYTQALTISSSPLPLPPWSSSGEQEEGAHFDTLPLQKQQEQQSGKEDLDTLVDFSLPPPPPLGMSSSPWR
ncbi:hypothetical protein Q7P37_000750 [Cladosporium fusiforme]